MEQKTARIQEIYRRGLQDKLPADKRAIADELIRRGTIQIEQSGQQLSEQQPQDTSLSGLQQPTTSGSEALGRGLLEGTTFGLASRVAPAISAGVAKTFGGEFTKDIPFKELYGEARDIYKQEKQVAREEQPIAAFGGEIAGAILSPVNPISLKVAKAMGGGIKGAIAAASGEGALAGLGYTKDMTKPKEVLKDIGTGALVGGVLGGSLYGAGKGLGILAKPLKRLLPAKKRVISDIKATLRKEGVDATEALRKMTDEGLDLVDVVDPRSALVSSLPQKTYEKATIDQIDNYVNRLNTAGNRVKTEVLDMVSKNKISSDDGALLLGKNAQRVIDDQFKIRTANAKPLYDKAFKSSKEIMDANDELLQRPVVRDAIAKVRAESAKFGDTAIGNIKDLPDNSLPVLHQAKGYLYRKSKDFTDMEAKRYGDVYAELSTKLQKSKPYKEATDIWAGETEGLEQLYKQKGVGNIAKKYMNNDIDGIKSSMKNVFNKTTTTEELARIKSSMSPDEFSSIVRRDLENLVDDAGDKANNLTISLFGKSDTPERSLKNKRLELLFGKEGKKGLRKMTDALDLARLRTKEVEKLKFAKPASAELGFVPGARQQVFNMVSNLSNNLIETPAYRREYINFITSSQGKQILEQMAKANKEQTYNALLNINRIVNQQIQQMNEETNGN